MLYPVYILRALCFRIVATGHLSDLLYLIRLMIKSAEIVQHVLGGHYIINEPNKYPDIYLRLILEQT